MRGKGISEVRGPTLAPAADICGIFEEQEYKIREGFWFWHEGQPCLQAVQCGWTFDRHLGGDMYASKNHGNKAAPYTPLWPSTPPPPQPHHPCVNNSEQQ